MSIKPNPYIWALLILVVALVAPDFVSAFVIAVLKPLLGGVAAALVLINIKAVKNEKDT